MKYGIMTLMLFCMTGSAFGQGNFGGYPTSVTNTEVGTDERTYHRHNENLETQTGEEVEYVTAGSTMRYFVMPNQTANPEYDQGDPFDFTKLLSTFTWSWDNTALGTISPLPGTRTSSPFISVQFNNASYPGLAFNNPVSGVLNVLEVPDQTQVNACTDANALTEMPVSVIPRPQTGFVANSTAPNTGLFYDSECIVTLPSSGFSITLPITVTTADVISTNPDVKITYDVAIDGGATIITNGVYSLPNNAQTELVIPVPDANIGYNRYVITITDITDRISRKSFVPVPGDIITAGGANVYTWEVMEPVRTGPIFRIPNLNNL